MTPEQLIDRAIIDLVTIKARLLDLQTEWEGSPDQASARTETTPQSEWDTGQAIDQTEDLTEDLTEEAPSPPPSRKAPARQARPPARRVRTAPLTDHIDQHNQALRESQAEFRARFQQPQEPVL